ncbi:hypothetical protein SSX86_015901 [Deinandra increscens subsp. villosa]|uniref:Formin-like protein n=1 Tax=Deinandra increscens subsp. villosa TaxID=3103831 RepID=A0AAP0CX27_9ASTR
MVSKIQFPPLFFFFFFLFSSSFLPQSSSQFAPQNIQVFFPFHRHHPPPPPPLPPPPPPLPSTETTTPTPVGTNSPSNSSNKTVVAAVAATAASTLVLSGLLFLLLVKYKRHLKEKEKPVVQGGGNGTGNTHDPVLLLNNQVTRIEGIRGVIVDEEGLDVLYWRNLDDEDGRKKTIFKKEQPKINENGEDRPINVDHGERKSGKFDVQIQEVPLLRGKSSGSHIWPSGEENKSQNGSLPVLNQEILMKSQQLPPPPSPPPPPQFPIERESFLPPPPPPPLPPKTDSLTSSSTKSPPPPPPQVERKSFLPPPPLLSKTSGLTSSSTKSPPPPLPPPPKFPVERKSFLPPSKTNSLSSSPPPPPPPQLPPPPPPPLQPKTDSLTSSSKLPPPTPIQLKPLHWEKVNTNVGHPTAWDKMNNGSFRFDGELMEAMFETVAANRKSPLENNSPTPKTKLKSGPPSQRFILETRKSQNIAIILRSLAVSRQEITDCLIEGKGLDIDTLEKLTNIRLTEDEQQLILNYDQDITRLADAESFLYHILKAVPSAFTRFNAMFFKLNYTSEVSEIKNSLQTLEMACKELKTRGLFLKLLEAVLKAGNRMNVGTSRGNAQAFNLNSLLKLSDVKSIDGKTTLLHFVVEEVVRLEGKRCMINRNHSLRNCTVSLTRDTSGTKDYIMLGLPIVGGVSSEFSNVKKAADIDYDILLKSCSGLSDHLSEIKKTAQECSAGNGDGEGRGFVREIEKFVERGEHEIQILMEDQERAIGLVKKTNEYYQAGASNDKGKKLFQLFVIVKAFLEMVDKACVDITIKLQKRKNGGGSGGEEAEAVVPKRPTMKFPVLPPNFISSSSSSDSEEDDDL